VQLDSDLNSLLFARKAAYNEGMEISFAPELEAKLDRIASHAGKRDEWFKREVGKGLASLDQGKTVSHEEVRRQMDRILGS
jgi:predicted transcriptional regulator